MKTTIRTTKRGRQQQARPVLGMGGRIYIATLNWPSLGITPDKPEWGLRNAAGPLAFSRDRDALVGWAKRNFIDLPDEQLSARGNATPARIVSFEAFKDARNDEEN